ncbi:polysaccharide biosynthesis C-terminal domain-containing protein [Neobacillus sp.]|uniref:lipopolysaccharide biosynthesis protein n=1 Tax=Neobacillus sp. TaxID=2675273 RepID=UPI00289D15E0|nr:polysaccharide biosynthesis C-terminal domain-containing protein [Neobacillus sp.]
MNSYNKLAKNSIIFAVGNIGSKLITLFMLPFYTRLLTKEDYGQIDFILTTIALILPLFTVSIVEAVVRFSLDRKNYSYGKVMTNSVFFIISGFILLLGIYPLISQVSFIGHYDLIFYSVFFIQAVDGSVKQFARSINLSKVYMISDMLYTFVFVSFNILFILYFKMGVQGYFLSMILAYVFDLAYLLKKTRVDKYIRIAYLDKKTMKAMLFYCIPLIPNTIMWWIMSISDRYILVYFLGLSANGLYAVANKFPSIISTVSAIFFQAWQVSAIEEYDNANKDKFYSNVFNVFFFVMLISTSIYMLFNKLIISILVSNEFYSAWKYAPILVLGVVFSSFSSFIGTNYVAMKKTKGAFYTSFIGALINFILNLLLVPTYGIYGAAIATLISFITMWGLRIFDTRKFVKVNYPIIKMILSLFLIGMQLLIGYLDLKSIAVSIINILILFMIILLSLEYTKKPVLFLWSNFLKNKG